MKILLALFLASLAIANGSGTAATRGHRTRTHSKHTNKSADHSYGWWPRRRRAPAPRTVRSRAYHHRPWSFHEKLYYGHHRGRDPEQREKFERMTGYPQGRSGYVVDHIRPLACGGPDDPSNMQWQTVAEAKAKDKWERRGCK